MHGSSSKLLQDQREAKTSQEKPSKGNNSGPETETQPSGPSEKLACQQTLVDILNEGQCDIDLKEPKDVINIHGPSSQGPRTTLIVHVES